MKAFAQGAVAGLVATVPMTLAMELLWRRLPPDERYPLPPREIIDRTLPSKLRKEVGDTACQQLTIAAHFAYGAAVGAVFPSVTSNPHLSAGATYGIVVWAASYLGWIPALGILRPASQHPARRNLLMIGAHLIWGATLSVVLGQLKRSAGSRNTGKRRGAHCRRRS